MEYRDRKKREYEEQETLRQELRKGIVLGTAVRILPRVRGWVRIPSSKPFSSSRPPSVVTTNEG